MSFDKAVKKTDPPQDPRDLDDLVGELEVMAEFRRNDPTNTALMSNAKAMFDPDDVALLEFLHPPAGSSGPVLLRAYMPYHSPKAGDFVADN